MNSQLNDSQLSTKPSAHTIYILTQMMLLLLTVVLLLHFSDSLAHFWASKLGWCNLHRKRNPDILHEIWIILKNIKIAGEGLWYCQFPSLWFSKLLKLFTILIQLMNGCYQCQFTFGYGFPCALVEFCTYIELIKWVIQLYTTFKAHLGDSAFLQWPYLTCQTPRS